ncbi:MAG TPA: type II toxin-antitoxin system VapC family toxin [Burkholderiaceae bacterium]|nr:type II toxin-antitoxin system VapC family toxin [Burkholderiaceae bacterium]
MLDTNICIYLMRHQPPSVAARFASCWVGDVVISAITLAELEYGVACTERERRPRVRRALARFVAEVPVEPFDGAAAAAYGPVRVASRDRRRDALDRLIAAHALALDVTLVTNNVADFAGYPALRVENWVDET